MRCDAVLQLHTAQLLAPLTVPLVMKAFMSSVTPDTSVKIFSGSSTTDDALFHPVMPASLCRKPASPDQQILHTSYVLVGRNFSQWKETLSGEIGHLENSQLALKMQRNTQRFVSFVQVRLSLGRSRSRSAPTPFVPGRGDAVAVGAIRLLERGRGGAQRRSARLRSHPAPAAPLDHRPPKTVAHVRNSYLDVVCFRS